MILENEDILRSVINHIMTEMFFIFPDMDDEGLPLEKKEADTEYTDVVIHFHTDYELCFRIEHQMLREMAANFLGLSPEEIDTENLEGMALETANIIGGNYLVEIDPDKQYTLSIPELRTGHSVVNAENRKWCMGFVCEDSAIIVWPQKRE